MAERNVWQWLKQDLDKQRSQLSYPMMKRLEVSNRRGWFDVLLCIRQVTVFFELKFVKGTYEDMKAKAFPYGLKPHQGMELSQWGASGANCYLLVCFAENETHRRKANITYVLFDAKKLSTWHKKTFQVKHGMALPPEPDFVIKAPFDFHHFIHRLRDHHLRYFTRDKELCDMMGYE